MEAEFTLCLWRKLVFPVFHFHVRELSECGEFHRLRRTNYRGSLDIHSIHRGISRLCTRIFAVWKKDAKTVAVLSCFPSDPSTFSEGSWRECYV